MIWIFQRSCVVVLITWSWCLVTCDDPCGGCPDGHVCVQLGPIHFCDEEVKRTTLVTQGPPDENRIKDACHPNYTRPGPEYSNCAYVCENGICDIIEGQTTCVCDQNANLPNCAKTCCKKCSPYGECVVDLNDNENCTCHPAFIGEYCEIERDKLPDPCVATYHPLVGSRTECGQGKCIHGICRKNETDAYCECYSNAYGESCEGTCCLDCGYGGICVVDDVSRNLSCECREQFSGEFCNSTGEFVCFSTGGTMLKPKSI